MKTHYLIAFDGATHLIPADRVLISVAPTYVEARTDLYKDTKAVRLDAFPEAVTVEEGLAAVKQSSALRVP